MQDRAIAVIAADRRAVFAGVGCGVFVALALFLWPAAAQGQTRPLRGPCQGAASPLTVSPSGGTATFTADASIQFTGSPSYIENCAVSTGPNTWNVQRTCTYHCQHWHTFLPTGVPLPADTTVTPSVPSGSYLLGWSSNCSPAYGQPRTSCTLKMNGAQTVVAAIGAAPDTSPPTAPVVTASKVESFAVTLSWTGAGDDHWVGGYDIYKNGQLAGRAGPGARSFRVTNGVFCQTNHTFRVEAFDTANVTPSPEITVRTGRCQRPKPNTIMHFAIPTKRVTKSRNMYLHWGSNRSRVTYQCRLDRGVWRRCRPGKTYRRLKVGRHVFRVRARDSAGVDPSPAVYRWRIIP